MNTALALQLADRAHGLDADLFRTVSAEVSDLTPADVDVYVAMRLPPNAGEIIAQIADDWSGGEVERRDEAQFAALSFVLFMALARRHGRPAGEAAAFIYRALLLGGLETN